MKRLIAWLYWNWAWDGDYLNVDVEILRKKLNALQEKDVTN
jgi:hypothetical protein